MEAALDRAKMPVSVTTWRAIVPKGTRGAAYVHPFPSYRFRQYEVLLNIGVKLRIVRNDGAQLVLVAGDEVGDAEQ